MGRPEQSHWRDSNYPRGTGRWWGGAGRADERKGSGNQKEAEVRARCSLHSLGKGAARNCGLSSLTYCSQRSFRSGHKLPCPPGLASSLTAGTKEEALVRALITVMLPVPTLQTFCSFQHDLWTEHGTGGVLARSRSAGEDVKSEPHSLEKVDMLPVCPLDSPTLLYKTSTVTERPPHMQARESFHRMLEVPTKILELFFNSFHPTLIFFLEIETSGSKEHGEREQMDSEIKEFGCA